MPRFSGKNGSIYLADSTTKLLDSYMWEYEEMQEVADCTIKGERFRRYAAAVGHGRVRIQSFVSTQLATPLTSRLGIATVTQGALVSSLGVGSPVDFTLEMVDAGSGSPVIQGSGYITRSQVHVARDGIITDEIEIEVDDLPIMVN